MKVFKALDDNFEKYFLIATLIFMVVIIFIQVVLRYCFDYSIKWAEELARYVMLYQIWIGAAYAVKEDAHLRITFIRDRFNSKNQIKMEVMVTVLWSVFALFMAVKGSQLTNILLSRGQISPALRIPMGYAYASVPVGCALMLFRLLQKMYKDVQKLYNQEVK